jgi:molybdopterin converting factor subunit 1
MTAETPSPGQRADPGGEQVTVLLFALAREAAGQAEVQVTLHGDRTVGALRRALATAYPALSPLLSRTMVAVNQSYASDGTRLEPGDEIAVIPPVSGGGGVARVTGEPLELGQLVQAVSHRGAGGIVTFLGVVRDRSQGRRVCYLEYEGYAPMAVRELEAITREVETRWPGCRVAVAHRTGRLEIGEAAVAIAVSAAHRAEAFAACRQVIEALKVRVPIWKKEHFEGGEIWVEGPHAEQVREETNRR